MNPIVENLKRQYQAGGMYLRLIFINVGVFLVFGILEMLIKLFDSFTLLKFSGQLISKLVFTTDFGEFIFQPWSILTHMFMHYDMSHILWNMLMLFYMGRLFELRFGPRKTLSTYLLGGMAGAVLTFLSIILFPGLQGSDIILLGASGSIMAIMAAAALYDINYEVHLFGVFKIKLIIIAGIMFAGDVLALGNHDGVGHFAHVGGALYGYLFLTQFKKGNNINAWLESITDYFASFFKKGPRMKVSHSKFRKQKKSASTAPPRDDYDYNQHKKEKQAKLDAILDKIKEGGYEKLSAAEKEFLSKF